MKSGLGLVHIGIILYEIDDDKITRNICPAIKIENKTCSSGAMA